MYHTVAKMHAKVVKKDRQQNNGPAFSTREAPPGRAGHSTSTVSRFSIV